MFRRIAAALIACSTLVACGLGAARATPSGSAPATGAAAATPLPHKLDEWTTFMGDAARSGIGPATPAAGNAHRTWTAPVDGDVYGGPLVTGGAVIAATERNQVYALDAGSGAVRWRTRLGDPVPLSQLECGNIDPNGVTSTPIADPGSGLLFVVAMLASPLRHELFALQLADGAVAWHRAVDAPGADPRLHQQRGALNLGGGYVYIAYGGFTGDCGSYHGRVVRVAADGGGPLQAWQVLSNNLAGVWSPGGPVISAAGEVWLTTGNTEEFSSAASGYDGANAVYRLKGDLSDALDQWAPRNWAALNRDDIDLGSLSPALLPGGLVFAAGKEGIGYLLHQNHLGGIGGEAFKAVVCPAGGPTGGAFGSAAVAGGMVYVPCKDGLAALRVDGVKPAFNVAWRVEKGVNSPVLAYGLVWTVAADPAGYRSSWKGGLVGLDPAGGAVRARVDLGPLPHFPSPAAASGSLYVAGQGSVYAVSAT